MYVSTITISYKLNQALTKHLLKTSFMRCVDIGNFSVSFSRAR